LCHRSSKAKLSGDSGAAALELIGFPVSNTSLPIPKNAFLQVRTMNSPQINRRQFTSAITAAGICAATGGSALANVELKKKLELGVDNFAVRAMGWKAEELIDYAAKLNVDSMFITDLYAFRSLEDKALEELKKKADDLNINLYVGTWSICPTSTRFKDEWGTAEEHLALGIRVAKGLGASSIRVVLGGRTDRTTDGGIEARIEDTVKVLKAMKSRAVDAGVKVAMENHAGDMHSLELVQLIEAAGKDLVGVNLDSGNAVWTMEDPLVNLENLGPYTLTTSLRDTAVWESENGITAQWTAMGEGMVDWEKYFARFVKLCPHAPVNIETISGFNHEIAFKSEDYMKAWPKGKPAGFDKFAAWAKGGKPRAAHQRPEKVDPKKADQDYQRGDIERSIAYCKKIGLGRK
jgi:sugar phosphate isomerase/epimerase